MNFELGKLKFSTDFNAILALCQGLPEDQIMDYRGHKILVSSHGRFHKFKWVWDGAAKDLTTGRKGSSRHYKSRQGAKEHAIEDLLKQY